MKEEFNKLMNYSENVPNIAKDLFCSCCVGNLKVLNYISSFIKCSRKGCRKERLNIREKPCCKSKISWLKMAVIMLFHIHNTSNKIILYLTGMDPKL